MNEKVPDIMREKYRPTSTEEMLNIDKVKKEGAALWRLLDKLGDSRSLNIAKSKVEEAVMWAVKHITE